jgi:hypothetical protein
MSHLNIEYNIGGDPQNHWESTMSGACARTSHLSEVAQLAAGRLIVCKFSRKNLRVEQSISR